MNLGLLIPVRQWKAGAGRYTFPDRAVLSSPHAADALALTQVQHMLNRCGVKRVHVEAGVRPGTTLRVRRSSKVTQAEGYRLAIARDGITVEAGTDAGAFYALQTLRDLLALHGRSLPCGVINDYPDLPRRGLYLDTARGKVPTLDTLKALIERMARWKLNELQLYVENNFAFAFDPAIGRGFSPFTPADLHALQAYGQQHHVRLVGSLASFGHMEMVLRLPKYQRLAELPGYYGYLGGTTLCPGDPGSIKLVRELYAEFAVLFDATDFNACGDEPWELGKGRSRARCEKVGKGRVYLDYMKALDGVCRDLGKRTNVWADIVLEHPELLSEWPKDIVMLNWAYLGGDDPRIKQSRLIAEAGLPWMACSGTHGWGSHGSRLATAMRNVSAFAAEARRSGAQGLLHTDWGDGGHRNPLAVSLCSIAHAGAHAWYGQGVDDADFVQRFCHVTFGQADGRMAASVQALGGVCDRVGDRTALYYSLREPVVGRRRKRYLRVDHARDQLPIPFDVLKDDGLEEVGEMLRPLREPGGWPTLLRGADAFDRQMLNGYRVAAMLDAVLAERGLLARQLRAGKSVSGRSWKALEGDLCGMRQVFAQDWLASNRPSRLQENLSLFDAAIKESRALAEA